ncbi:MAG: MDR family MFS transporter [Acidimicrobiales bacterium]|jgi:EmrB/QacA subfamily drug resistance transporter
MARFQMNPKISVSVVFVAAMFMSIMDITIVNVALPAIGRQFHESTTALDSVAVGYLVSLAVFIPAAGWLGDRFGMKRILLMAVAIFTGASVLCGLAGSLSELVLFRVLQGVGGGLMTPVGMAMLFRTFPPEERVRASSILVVPTAVAPAMGPVLGGLLVTDLSWRWVFFVNLPFGIVAIVFGILFLAEHRQPDPGSFDLRGFLLSGIGFALVMFGVSEGPDRGWGSPGILASIVVGAVLLTALVQVERRTAKPILQLRLFGNRLFRSASLVLMIGMASFLGVLFVAPLFFQIALGLSALQSGLNTFPEALGVMVGAQLATRIFYPRVGPRRLVSAALVGVAASMALMSFVGFDTNLWWMRVLMFTMGLSMSQVFISSQAAAFATVSHAETGQASSLFNSGRQLGSALGVALLATVLAAVGTTHVVAGHTEPNLSAYHAAFLTAAVISLVASGVALTIKDADAAATMVRRVTHKVNRDAVPIEPNPSPQGAG